MIPLGSQLYTGLATIVQPSQLYLLSPQKAPTNAEINVVLLAALIESQSGAQNISAIKLQGFYYLTHIITQVHSGPVKSSHEWATQSQ